MKNKFYLIFSIIIVLSMLLAACQTSAPETEALPPVEKTEEVAPPPTEAPKPTEVPTEVPAPVIATEEDLDTSFSAMLDNMKKYDTIKMDGLLEEMTEDQPPFIIDIRTKEEVEKSGHIEGAVWIPLNELAQHIDIMPALDVPVVTYCGTGWRATIAMTALHGMGWTNVRALKTKFQDWIDAGNPVGEGLPSEAETLNAAEPDPGLVASMNEMLTNIPKGYGVIKADDLNTALVESPDLILIDVRTPEEVEKSGYIDNGDNEPIFIPLEQFIAERDNFPTDKDAEIVVYCGSGHRSTMGMTMLWSFGFTNVSSLAGGFTGWIEGGFPVKGGVNVLDEAFTTMLDNMVKYNTIKMDDLNASLTEDQPPFLIDVRTEKEVTESGHIEGAVWIPLDELAQHMDIMPDFDTPIVTYCGTGWRATIAMVALNGMGWSDVKALKAKFTDWVDAGYTTNDGLPPEALVLNIAEPDPALVSTFNAMLSSISKGYGVLKADALNTELTENPDLIIIDVRTDQELQDKGIIDSGDIPQIHIPLENFIAQMDQIPTDKDAQIVIYCGSGHRSTMAMTMLWTYGYSNVRSLAGGFTNWVEQDYPIKEYATP